LDNTTQRALDLRADGKIDDAIELLYEALGDDFGNAEVIGVLASMLSETEQFERAERLFKRALAQPDVPTYILLNYATFLAASGRHADAKEHFSNAAAHAVTDLQGLIHASGARGPAVEAVEQLAVAECNLARTYHELGDYGVARALAEKWMTLESAWETAADIVFASIEREGLDVDAECARYHAAGRAAPSMAAELVHQAHEAPSAERPFEALHIATRAFAYLHFDWMADLEGFEEELLQVWQAAGEALTERGGGPEDRAAHRFLGDVLGLPVERREVPNEVTLAFNRALAEQPMLLHACTGPSDGSGDNSTTCCGENAPDAVLSDDKRDVGCPKCVEAIEDALAWRARVDAGQEDEQPDGPTGHSDGALDRYYDAYMLSQARKRIADFWQSRW